MAIPVNQITNNDARLIPLNLGMHALVDASDFEHVSTIRWSALRSKSKFSDCTYAINSNVGLMHRLIIGAPCGYEVDHINGDGTDNRRANLRVCTRAQNAAARNVPVPKSGYRWVKMVGRRFYVVMTVSRVERYFGGFDTAIAAAHAADAIALAQWGQFARLNFPSDSGGP